MSLLDYRYVQYEGNKRSVVCIWACSGCNIGAWETRTIILIDDDEEGLP